MKRPQTTQTGGFAKWSRAGVDCGDDRHPPDRKITCTSGVISIEQECNAESTGYWKPGAESNEVKMWSNWLSLSLLVALLPTEAARVKLDDAITRRLLHSGKPRIGLWQALHEQKVNELAQATISDHDAQATFEVASKPKYEAYCFEQPLTHFSSSANTTFCQRYWMDASAYREGGPVFVLDGGETDGAGRLPYLEKGILQILANETGGLSIVLEHR